MIAAVRDTPAHKLAGAALVAALHILIAAAFLRATFAPHGVNAPRETILFLAPPKPKVVEKPAAPSHIPLPRMQRPDSRAITLPQSPGVETKALEGLGRALFGCRPENIANLSPEERTACAKLGPAPDHSVDFADHTNRSRDAALWARGRARKNGPALLPCASNAGIGVGLGTLLCLGDGLANGFKPDQQPIYGDRADELHVPNNGDPHPAYTDPDH